MSCNSNRSRAQVVAVSSRGSKLGGLHKLWERQQAGINAAESMDPAGSLAALSSSQEWRALVAQQHL